MGLTSITIVQNKSLSTKFFCLQIVKNKHLSELKRQFSILKFISFELLEVCKKALSHKRTIVSFLSLAFCYAILPA